MLREKLNQQKSESKSGFRYRGVEVSRLENLTDAVFGFAITLLVIASEVPRTYVELQSSMYDFVGFLFCSLLLLGIWNNHKSFFLHYGMRDSFTQVMNFLFLFVLLFYIYPLKYLFSYVGTGLLIFALKKVDYASEALNIAIHKISMANMNIEQWEDLMIRFSLGLVLIYGIFFLLHLNALQKKEELMLNELEVYQTKSFMIYFLILIAISLASMVVVLIWGGRYAPHAGVFYLLIPVLLPIAKSVRSKKLSAFVNA